MKDSAVGAAPVGAREELVDAVVVVTRKTDDSHGRSKHEKVFELLRKYMGRGSSPVPANWEAPTAGIMDILNQALSSHGSY